MQAGNVSGVGKKRIKKKKKENTMAHRAASCRPAMPVRSMDVRSSHERAIWIIDMVVAPPV